MTITSCQSPLFVSHVTPAPTPQCVEPTLTLGMLNYRIESVARDPEAFPEIPGRKKDVAYWVEGTTTNYVFGLSPTIENLALNSVLKTGDPAIISWADCSQDKYVVKSVDTAQPSDLNIFDQSIGGLTVYVQTDSSSLVIRGERPTTKAAETPVATLENAIQLDIQISDLAPPDDQSVKIRLDITNQGAQLVTLTNSNISLTIQDGQQTFPQVVEPALPQEIQPGGNLSIAVVFAKPRASSAVLKILDTTFEYFFQ